MPSNSKGAALLASILIGVFSPAALQSPDPDAVLHTTGQRLLADLDRMPRYTCVQTITRYYYRPIARGRSCSALMTEYDGALFCYVLPVARHNSGTPA